MRAILCRTYGGVGAKRSHECAQAIGAAPVPRELVGFGAPDEKTAELASPKAFTLSEWQRKRLIVPGAGIASAQERMGVCKSDKQRFC
jgi:hypothetical protein